MALACAVMVGAGGLLAPSAQAAGTTTRQQSTATPVGTEVGSVSVTRPDGTVAQIGDFQGSSYTSLYLWSRTQLVPGGPYGDWQQVSSVGLNFQNPVLSAAADADGGLEVFTDLYETGSLVRIHQATPNGAWSTPAAFGPGNAEIPRFFGYPVLFQKTDGTLAFFEVYQIGTVPELYVNEQDSTGAWGAFTDLGAGPEPESVGVPTSVTEASNGTLTAVAHLWDASSGYYAEISELAPGGPWGAWQSCATDGCVNG